MANVPVYSSPHNGIIGDASSTASAGQINQFLGTHAATVLYQGASILTPNGSGGNGWVYPLSTLDIDQPFTMSGTAIGRVEIPVLAVGAGADLLVSLCQDNPTTPNTPGTVVNQTRIPANWFTQLSAVTGEPLPSSDYPLLTLTGSPLAAARFNPYRQKFVTGFPYPFPAVSLTGVAATPTTAYYDNGSGTSYLYTVGGVDSGLALNNSFAISGNSAGAIGVAVPQPNYPQLMDGSGKGAVVVESSGTVTLVTAGGASSFGGTPTGAVYTAVVQPGTGNLGAWSSQTAVPVNIQNQGMCTANGYVYIVGGCPTPNGTPYTSVYYGQVQNSQITGWTETTPFPTPIVLPYIAVINGFVLVAGGSTTTIPTKTAASYYAPINTDGSLGQWIPGPDLLAPDWNPPGTALADSDFGTFLPGFTVNSSAIGFTATGPSATWVNQSALFFSSAEWYVSTGPGTSTAFYADYTNEMAGTTALSVTPTISVPLPATGLANGAIYHILVQQQGGSLGDYLVVWDDFGAFNGGKTVRTSPRGTYTWSHVPSAHQVPLQVYDQSALGPPLHTWNDTGARITTIVQATTPDQRVLGLCEAARQATALNANTSFESGISPWTITGGTANQSTAEVYQGQYALQITPSGSAATVSAASEILPCMPGQWCTATGRVWFTNAVTSNYSTSIVWYTAVTGGTQISTSTNPVSVPAGTWTQESQALQAPAGAYGFQILATLSGTPASSQVWYLDTARGYPTYVGPQASTVSQVTASASWPEPWIPTGVLQLA